jgi:DNA modification methylase
MENAQYEGRNWSLVNGDCVEVMAQMPDESVDHACFSSPFGSLYIYSDSERDMGNSHGSEQFNKHHQYMADQLFRVMKPGTVICDHVKDTVFYQGGSADGQGGIFPFSDDALANYRRAGFVLRARVTFWRDPVRERDKTNHERLLYGNIGKNSRVCAMGMPEYILVMRKESKGLKVGDPVRHAVDKGPAPQGQATQKFTETVAGQDYEWMFCPDNWATVQERAADIAAEDAQRMLSRGMIEGASPELLKWLAAKAKFDLRTWQEWASPVWMNTNQMDVVHGRFFKNKYKSEGDERHICPMPLDLIERCLTLYSAPGDVVFDPFSGVGSTGYTSVRMGRKFFGSELKPEYAKQAAKIIKEAERDIGSLLDVAAE